ncbi:hypothetical protein [Cryptosporangium aurantiacum]|uniref:hypothetical protein n=1 Tax=Cryptosporangium aurantiacum TaxID=134849 RepID=UPI001160E3B5|nr:hypothetical protein [Cryptosporangium aurantiacum]
MSVVGAVTAIITGHIAARRTAAGSESRSFAIAGLIFGYSYLFTLVTGFWYAVTVFSIRGWGWFSTAQTWLDRTTG